MESAGLDQDGGHRAAALVEAGFDHGAPRRTGERGLELKDLRLQEHGVEQIVDAQARLGGDLDHHGVATPLLGHHLVLGQLLHDPVRVGGGLVHLVDGDHDRHLGGPGVLDGLHGLGHDPIVRRHHQDDDVGDLGAAGPHGGEGSVARGVKEGHHAARRLHVISADMLGDAAGLTRRHLGATDVVEQRGLAMVDVTHDGDHRWAGLLGQLAQLPLQFLH